MIEQVLFSIVQTCENYHLKPLHRISQHRILYQKYTIALFMLGMHVRSMYTFAMFVRSVCVGVCLVCVYVRYMCTLRMRVRSVCVYVRYACMFGTCVHTICVYVWYACTFGMRVHLVCVYVWYACALGMCVHSVRVCSLSAPILELRLPKSLRIYVQTSICV